MKKERLNNYDLLRVISIFLILIWHFENTSIDAGCELQFLPFFKELGSINAGGIGVAFFYDIGWSDDLSLWNWEII